MKKHILDLEVTENTKLNDNYVLIKLTSESLLPEMIVGQFAEIRVDNSQATYLRRPISIHYIDRQRNELWLLIQLVGNGTKSLAQSKSGDTINAILPLGNGFSMPKSPSQKLLLIGGGVGIAPLLFLGEQLARAGSKPVF
ncbi:Dihydroorotate dehydrogenase B (NAD(+)) electron transfer subunit, partial [termite gut metagenome]